MSLEDHLRLTLIHRFWAIVPLSLPSAAVLIRPAAASAAGRLRDAGTRTRRLRAQMHPAS